VTSFDAQATLGANHQYRQAYLGQMGQAGQANYAASKAGLIGLTMAIARETGVPEQLPATRLLRGFIDTAMDRGC